MRGSKKYFSVAIAAGMLANPALAQEDAGNAATQANNPLANTSSVNLQNQYSGNLTGVDEYANSVYLRSAVPFQAFGSTVIARATLPINTFPTGLGGGHN